MQTTCPICGRIDDHEEYIDSRIKLIMEERKCCFHCAFWFSIAEGDPDMEDPSEPVVVNHTHWSYPRNEPVHFQEHPGWTWRPVPTMHYILFEDGRTAQTNQLWHQGTVPEYFYNEIQNNAVFISRAEFDQIREHVSNKDVPPIEATCPQPLLNFLLKKYEFSK